MPELPEVETIKNGLSPHIIGQYVKSVALLFPTLRYPIPKDIPSRITKYPLNNILRRGKYLIFIFPHVQLIIHLGMSGKITLTPHHTPRIKHDHFEICFDTIVMRLNDPRRFGCVLLTKDYTTHSLIRNLGVEPLEDDFTSEYMLKQSQGKSVNIKNFIMNSGYVVGVGNIYASESLFRASIHPLKSVGTVSKLSMQKLVISICEVLNEAIKSGGTTLKNYSSVTGELGYFAISLKVYGKENESCVQCGTKIKKITQQQRSTFYCPQCQK